MLSPRLTQVPQFWDYINRNMYRIVSRLSGYWNSDYPDLENKFCVCRLRINQIFPDYLNIYTWVCLAQNWVLKFLELITNATTALPDVWINLHRGKIRQNGHYLVTVRIIRIFEHPDHSILTLVRIIRTLLHQIRFCDLEILPSQPVFQFDESCKGKF